MTVIARTPELRPVGGFEEIAPPLSREEALVEADRCLECGGAYAAAPCVVACPADVDVPRFVGQIARGAVDAAAQTIFAENLLGGTCARVCPVELLCEGACVLRHEDQPPIAIGRLQRHATDHAFTRGARLREPQPPRETQVAVIGAGPAGLVCAGELAARGHRVTVYEARGEVGGLVRFAIAPYRQQREPLPQEAQALARLGVEFRLGTPIGRREDLLAVEASVDAVFLGVGLGKDVPADLEGRNLPGVWESLPFVEAIKTGRPPTVGSRVAVIGGGNTAIDVAREALRLGADEATIVYRRSEAEMPAFPHEVEEARREGVCFRFLAQPFRFRGSGRLEGLECRAVRLGAPDESGRPRPEVVPGSEFLIPAETAVVAIGQAPRRELLGWIDGLEVEDGLVKVDRATGRTANPKYFAAGDATNGGATVVEAVRGAKTAARAIDAELRQTIRSGGSPQGQSLRLSLGRQPARERT